MNEKLYSPFADHAQDDSTYVSSGDLWLIISVAVFMAILMALIGFFVLNGGWALISTMYVFGGLAGVSVALVILLVRGIESE